MKFFDKKFGIFEIIILFILVYVFNYMTYVCTSDIPPHVNFLIAYTNGTAPLPSNFLYYYVIYTIGFFTNIQSVLLLVSVYTLAFATLWKYFIVKNILISEIQTDKSKIIASVASFILIFCFSSPFILFFLDYYYLMSYSPNVWHNSTAIFVMPFSLLLFWQSVKQLDNFSYKRLFIITLLIILNVIAKPSYLFVYAIAFPILVLIKHKFSKLFWINLIPIFISLLLIAVQYYTIYESSTAREQSSVAIDFFHLMFIWTQFESTPYLLFVFIMTIISSFLFPILLLTKNKQLLKLEMVQLALLGVFFGIIIGITFYESGIREHDGNFLWQTIIASFILFFVCTLQLLKLIFSNKKGWKAYKMETLLFVIHFFSGLYYFYRIFSGYTYA